MATPRNPIDAIAASISEDITENNGLVDHTCEYCKGEGCHECSGTITEEEVRVHEDYSQPIDAVVREMAVIEEMRENGDDVQLQQPMIDVNRIREKRQIRDLQEALDRERLLRESGNRVVPRPLPRASSDIRIVGAAAARFVPVIDTRPVRTVQAAEVDYKSVAPEPEPIVESAPVPLTSPGERKLRL